MYQAFPREFVEKVGKRAKERVEGGGPRERGEKVMQSEKCVHP